jgi:scyllo-inositol 2-dehydrogenase (NADP+)
MLSGNGNQAYHKRRELMTRQEPFNVAIAGYGLAGATFHAPLIKATSGLVVRAIVTRSREKQERAAKDFPGASIADGLDKILSCKSEIDLVVIATPNKDHFSQATACLEAGLAVVVDKPAALNSNECLQLIECSKRHKKLLSVFQNRRWDADFLTVKKLIAEGRLGKILRFESRFERYRPEVRRGAWREAIAAEEGGGILLDLGSHLIDQATQLFGRPVRVYGEIDVRREGVLSDDDAFVALSFASGAKVHLWAGAMAASQGCRFRVLGTTGAYEKYGMDPQEDALRAGKTPLAPAWGQEGPENWGVLTTYENGQKRQERLATLPGAYQRFYSEMRDALKGIAGVPVEPEDSCTTLSIIEAARSSARTKEPLLLASMSQS